MRNELIRQLTGDEGKRRHVYKDHLGNDTIGVGRLVDARKPGSGLRDVEIAFMLQNDLDDRITQLSKRLTWFDSLDDARRGVIVNMSFQLGIEGLLGFENTLAMIERGDYDSAADGMLQSLWAKQTPERAKRLSEQMRTGHWVFAPGA
jgi:lysozyme